MSAGGGGQMPFQAFHCSIGTIDFRCLENSGNTLRRSGLYILSFQLSLELGRLDYQSLEVRTDGVKCFVGSADTRSVTV